MFVHIILHDRYQIKSAGQLSLTMQSFSLYIKFLILGS